MSKEMMPQGPGPGDFTSQDAWKAAREMTNAIYALEDRFPADEIPVLFARLREAAIDLGARVAEGYGSQSAVAPGTLSPKMAGEALGKLAALWHYISTCRDRFLIDDTQIAEFERLHDRIRAGCHPPGEGSPGAKESRGA